MESSDVLKLFDSENINSPKQNDYQKGKKDYKCNVCEQIIVGFPSTLKRHKISVHRKNQQPKGKKVRRRCDQCEKIIVGYPSTLNQHKKLVHGDNPVFECNVCGKTFKRKGDLNVHIKNHDNEPQFECRPCKKKMYKKTNLERHQEKFCKTIDKSNLQYQCTKCPKKFFAERGRDRHEQLHDESPVQCPVCHEFRSKSNLKSHIRVVHQQIKPFECVPCDMKFAEQHTLN